MGVSVGLSLAQPRAVGIFASLREPYRRWQRLFVRRGELLTRRRKDAKSVVLKKRNGGGGGDEREVALAGRVRGMIGHGHFLSSGRTQHFCPRAPVGVQGGSGIWFSGSDGVQMSCASTAMRLL